jgi:uncharacterized protein (TIGR02808 family)
MSALEAMIWNVLGYIAMPTIFIVGFAITAVVACFLLEVTGNGNKQ